MIGQRIGNYFVIGEIGFGSMGAVYKAKDRRSERTVALKILKEPLYESKAVERFLFNEGAPSVRTRNGKVTVVSLLGDVSGNGGVGAYDASLVLQHVVGLIPLVGPDSMVADVSGNGGVGAYDASLILRYTVGMIDRFPADGGLAGKPAIGIERIISVRGAEHISAGYVTVPVTIDEMEGVLAGEIEMVYAGAGVREVRTVDLTSEYLSAVNVVDGRICLSFAGVKSPTGSGRITEVIFDGMPVLSIDSVMLNEGRMPVRIEGMEPETPKAYRLSQNYPNPFNPETTITYDVVKTGTVRLLIYALTGQHIRTLVDGERPAGSYSVVWDGRDDGGQAVASGVYLCRMIAGDHRAVRKMLLMK